MYKKRILSLAIASVFTLTGCLDDNKIVDESNAGAGSIPFPSTLTYPVFFPATSELPLPNDLIFDAVAGDGTFLVPDSSPPVTTALNSLSGASTVAPIDLKISGLIDEDTVDGSPYLLDASGNLVILGGDPVPNPNQNVFLIELDYASGSALQGLSIPEPPTIVPAAGDTYAAEVKTLDGTSFIRINLKTPLKPLTRYIVVLTDDIKDINGDSIGAAPGLAGYDAIKDTNKPLANPALSSIRSLINGLWEPIASNYFAAATNAARSNTALSSFTIDDSPLSTDNIAMSYGLTTSGDEKVMTYIAEPAQWFDDQITTFVGVSTATAVVENQSDVAMLDSSGNIVAGSDGAVDHSDVSYSVNAALTFFPVNPSNPSDTTIADALGPLEAAFPAFGCTGVTSGPAYITCIGTVLAGLPTTSGGFANLLPTPAADTDVTFDDANILDINQVSSLTASLGIPAGLVSVVQGTMTVPYYLGVPSGANGTPLITESWVADDDLADAINGTFASLGLSLPQADALVSDVVNYIFPFPKKISDEKIPVLGIFPTTPAGPMKTVMYQHGITTDRSAALAYGGSLVAGAKGRGTDVAVIAIDQPLHGVDGISSAEQAALAETLLASASEISPDGVFDGLDDDIADQAAIDAAVDGSLVVGALLKIQGLGCPLGITDPTDLGQIGAAIATVEAGTCGPTAQAALAGAQTLVRTIANGASTVAGLPPATDPDDSDVIIERHFGFTSAGPGAAPIAMDYEGSSTTNSSGSMFINLLDFLNSRDNNRQLVPDLLAVRKTIEYMDLNGGGADLDADDVYFIGHSLGTINGLIFVATANSTASTTDDIVAANFLTPGGGTTRLLENSPSFGPAIVGGLGALGLTQDTSSFQAYLNVFQAAVDGADAINYVDNLSSPTLFSLVLGDQTISNSLDEADEVLGDGSISFLSGSEPLATVSSATTRSDADSYDPLGKSVVRYTAGTHGTPVFPSTGTAEEADVFAEMVGQSVSIVLTSGTELTISDDSIVD